MNLIQKTMGSLAGNPPPEPEARKETEWPARATRRKDKLLDLHAASEMRSGGNWTIGQEFQRQRDAILKEAAHHDRIEAERGRSPETVEARRVLDERMAALRRNRDKASAEAAALTDGKDKGDK
jgi:hypothetical protein